MTPQSPNDPSMPPRGGFNPEDRAPAEAYQSPDASAPANRSSKPWGWIIGVVAVVLIAVLVVCCGGGVWMFNFAADQVATQVQSDIADHPAIQEHIGEIESLELSVQKTAELDQPRRMVLTVEGSKGQGVIIGTQKSGTQELDDLVLQTPDGEQYPLEE